MPLLWVMKGSYFGFGSHRQQVHMHARSKNTSLSYNVHLFSPYLLNDSRTIHSMIHFSKPLLCVTLICGDWSDWFYFHSISPVMPDKAAFVRAVLFVYSVTGETAILPLQKRHLVTKNELAFSFRPRRKDQQYANVSCWRQHETAWDSF